MINTLKVGPLRYAILRVPKLTDAAGEKRLAGYIDYARCRVSIDADLAPQTERHALFHEGMHGWLSHMGRHEVPEALVDAIAFAALALFEDNPELFGPEDDEPYLSKETLARLRDGKMTGEAKHMGNPAFRYAYRAPLWRRVYLWAHSPVWKFITRVRYAITGKCGNACGYTEPYGWVPEAGCAVHDSD